MRFFTIRHVRVQALGIAVPEGIPEPEPRAALMAYPRPYRHRSHWQRPRVLLLDQWQS